MHKAIEKRLVFGQRISLTPVDERMLRNAFDYMAGYTKRITLASLVEDKTNEINELTNKYPKMLSDIKNTKKNNVITENKSEYDAAIDEYYIKKEELTTLEEKYTAHLASNDHKITLKDLESLTKKLGANISKRYLQHMIWEIDEDTDEAICWDEFQLTYYRNISDTTQIEPSGFFRILEFMTFDEQHKGYIVEDDCMELLFARYGSGKLEKELHLIFGAKLRAAGGDGKLDLPGFLSSVQSRSGGRIAFVV